MMLQSISFYHFTADGVERPDRVGELSDQDENNSSSIVMNRLMNQMNAPASGRGHASHRGRPIPLDIDDGAIIANVL
jgi:hypothetical protein